MTIERHTPALDSQITPNLYKPSQKQEIEGIASDLFDELQYNIRSNEIINSQP